MAEFQFSYSIVSEYIEFCIKKNSSKIYIKNVLSKLPHPFMGFHIPPTLDSLRKVAEIENVLGEFDEAVNEYKKTITNHDHWTYEIEVELIQNSVTRIYKDIFDNT